ncbi:HD domain-containing protein [Butyrivibrio sp. XB500-5]|uniref:HD domain-containing phosphohydrolase n=1 Tax=Butyrivibrio sp. XB500-5 TaxID=2364880 RepID=UPI000EAA4EE5|nr:HD domain-containing phosphohydrolase [Butyrivibrio sp. XB500-5]RKM62824.1 HD domain-containing protein [Butyrivibrio sp. XB500-5]
MKGHLSKSKQLQIEFIRWVVICVAVNIIALRITAFFNLPIYLDTIGTISMAFVWGQLPAIVVAVLTYLIYGFFIPDSMCYAMIGVFVAIRATVYIGKENITIKKLLCFILDSAFMSGVLGALFQWLLLEKPQLNYINDTARLMGGSSEKNFVIAMIILVITLNVIDKSISVLAAYGLYRLVPQDLRMIMWNSRWKQTPLSNKERKEIVQNSKKGNTSIMVKVVVVLMLVTIFTSVILGVVSSRVNFDEAKERGRNMSADVAKLVATSIEQRYLEAFAQKNVKVNEYRDVKYLQYNEMLMSLKESIPLIERLYVFDIKDDSIYMIFDTDEDFQKSGILGEKTDDANFLMDSMNVLYDGPESGSRESIGKYGYLITSYEQIHATEDKAFYVGAEVSLKDYNMFLKKYVIKITLTFSGFCALILSCGFMMAAHNLVYPIGALEMRIDEFMESIEDQDELDESVRKLERLDIRTNDELERLYNSICKMANTTAEQMRNVLTLAQSNEKMQAGLVATMADIVESQNIDSKAHIQKTTAYVRIILEGLKRKGYYPEKLTLKYMKDVEMSTPLYDIGKIKIPESILNKPDALTDEEFEIMKTHTIEGKKILDNTISSMKGENYLKEARNMAAYHHEHWDGTGYPEGLHGEVIPLSARIMAIADVFDAVTSLRVYKSASNYQDALDVILDGSGTRFDPKCVEAFADSFSEVKNILRKYS